MHDIITYIENELRTMRELAFSPVDSLILSEISYLQLDGIVPPRVGSGRAVIGDLARAEQFKDMLKNVPQGESNRQMVYRLAASPRFRDIPLAHYSNKYSREEERQFAAVTYFLPDGTAYIAYRGTDMTIVGWKEDFNMAYTCPVPAQQDGKDYLDHVGSLISDTPLRVGGHSKGGNIAVYASMMCAPEVRARIRDIYSHDGPGFRREVISGQKFAKIEGRIRKTVPQSSLIGMLLQNQEHYDVIKSNHFWIMQHDPFSWRVENSDFVYTGRQVTRSARYTSSTLNEWLSSRSDEERVVFIETVYQVISSTGAETFSELSSDWLHHSRTILRAARNLDDESKKMISQLVRELARMAVRNLALSMEPPRIAAKRRPSGHRDNGKNSKTGER